MKPLTVLLGFVLGSSAAITFSLLGLAIIYAVLGPEYPRMRAEVGPLLTALAVFAGLTALAGLSFYGELRAKRWRAVSLIGLVVALVLIGRLYWPD